MHENNISMRNPLHYPYEKSKEILTHHFGTVLGGTYYAEWIGYLAHEYPKVDIVRQNRTKSFNFSGYLFTPRHLNSKNVGLHAEGQYSSFQVIAKSM